MMLETNQLVKRARTLCGAVWRNIVVIGHRLRDIYKTYVFSEMVENASGTLLLLRGRATVVAQCHRTLEKAGHDSEQKDVCDNITQVIPGHSSSPTP